MFSANPVFRLAAHRGDSIGPQESIAPRWPALPQSSKYGLDGFAELK